MGRLPSALLSTVLVLGCAGRGAPGGRDVAEAHRPPQDVAAALARSLPPGASRCAVTRPGRVASRRRPLLQRISQGDPLAWLSGVPVQAYAWAEHVADDGSRPAVALLRLAGPAAELREQLDRDAPVRLQWSGERCADGPCSTVQARVVDARTVRIERGRWPHGGVPGVERRCAKLARQAPDAVEVAAQQGMGPIAGFEDHVPRHVDTVTRAGKRTITVERRRRMATREAARRATRRLAVQRHRLGGVTADDTRWRRHGRVIVTDVRLAWQDLQLAAEDDQRVRRARAEEVERSTPAPVDRVDVSNLAEVRQQVRLRREQLDRSRGPARLQRAEQLRRLLERALDAHPEQWPLARKLGTLLLHELEDGEGARRLAERMLSRSAPREPWWRRARREAAALGGEAALRRVLLEDRRVEPADAARAARDLVALRQQGIDYRWAESAWQAADALGNSAGGKGLRTVPEVELPLRSLLETAAVLAETGVVAGGHSIYVLVRPARYDGPLRARRHARLLEVHAADGKPALFAASPMESREQLRALGEGLARVLGEGDVEVAVAFESSDDAVTEPRAKLRLAGRVHDGIFVVERAAEGAGHGAPWPKVARYVAGPLASIDHRVFPPPELELEAASGDDAERLVALSERRTHVRCSAAGTKVRCETSVEGPDALHRLLERFLVEALDGDGP